MRMIQIDNMTFACPYVGLLPPLSDAEFAALRADIEERGVIVPVIADELRNIIDGEARMMISAELGLKDVPFEIRPGLTPEEKMVLAVDLNLHRRHASQEQIEELIVRLRQQGISYRQIGQTLDISHETARSTVNKLTVEQPEMITGRDGRSRPARRPSIIAKTLAESATAIEAAQLIERLPGKVIDVRRASRLARESVARSRSTEPVADTNVGTVSLLFGDFRLRGAEIPDKSVDVFFTDPEYNQEFLPRWSDLGRLASRTLKPGGLLLAYSGQSYLPQVIDALGAHLQYVWTCAALHSNDRDVQWNVKLYNKWKPILIYVKPPFAPTWHPFVDVVSGGKQKEFHEWQQPESEAEHFLRYLCPAGGMVVDPCVGSGTTAMVARRLGLRCIGIEINPTTFASAEARMRA
jgi:site-specific DNA-methyltransferase (adenine-specific)